MTGTVRVLSINLEKKTIEETAKDGVKNVYHKIP